MTEVRVDPGACGFICMIRVSRTEQYKVDVRMESECRQVAELAAEISELDFMNIMRAGFGQNKVFLSALRCKLHAACPAPTALIKAVEAELGMAVRKNVAIAFTGAPK